MQYRKYKLTPATVGSEIKAAWLNEVESEDCLCSRLALCQTASQLGVAVIDSSQSKRPFLLAFSFILQHRWARHTEKTILISAE